MDNKIKLHLEWVTSEIKKYESYHNHKETMAWLATAFYVTGVITLGLVINHTEIWIKGLSTFGILLTGYFIGIFVYMQFNMRWKSADIQAGLMRLASELCCGQAKPPDQPDFPQITDPEKVFPNHIQKYIDQGETTRVVWRAVKDLFKPGKLNRLDNRWKTELPSYFIMIIATTIALISLWIN